MGGLVASNVSDGSTSCSVIGNGLQHFTWLVLLLLALSSVIARLLLSPPLLPGRRRVLNVVLPGEVLPQPHAGALSLWSNWRCRLAWWRYAQSRGRSAVELAQTIKNDYEIKWLDGETPKNGDIVSAWDRVIVWGDDCVDMAVLEGMRDRSDDLSDHALEAIHQSVQGAPRDVLETIAERVAVHANNGSSAPQEDADLITFWQAIDRRPPLGCGVVGAGWLQEHGMLSSDDAQRFGRCSIDLNFAKQKAWHPTDEDKSDAFPTYDTLTPRQKALYDAEEASILARGKAVFHTYGPNMELGLLLVGLGGGFASGRITDVLRATGYLMSASRAGTQRSGVESAMLGRGASEEDYLARLAAYVEQAGAELARKGMVGNKEALGAQPQEQQRVPSNASCDRTYKRLLETAAFLLDVTETEDSLLPPSAYTQAGSASHAETGADLLRRAGKGWVACARVRFLHTGVRRRLLSPSHGAYPLGSGVPINQEDLLATLCAFSAAPLMALQAQGLTPTEQEVVDYIALWRHIGFYMGVEPRLLRRCFRDVHAAQAVFACISSHHFLPLAGKMDSSTLPPPSISSVFGRKTLSKSKSHANGAPSIEATLTSLPLMLHFDHGPALPLLWSVSDRPPGNMAFSTLCAIARFLLGDALANATALPATTPRQYLGLRLRLFVLAFPPLFARYYPRKQWGIDLRNNWIALVRRLVLYASEGRVAQFKSRVARHSTAPGETKKPPRDYADDDNPVVQLSPSEGQRIVREYRRLMREMAVVVLALVLLVAGVAWWAFLASYYALDGFHQRRCMQM